MATGLKKAFFRRINDQRKALESGKKPSQIIQNIINPGVLYEEVLVIGGFLMENEVITSKELDLARALVEDYSDRFKSLFPNL